MIRAVLIANRGEIAVRITRTLRTMGIRAIAVFSDADADALHVRTADAAYAIGPAPARDSYLDGAQIIAAARAAGADAVHPGYGFLAENAGFAETVEAAGLIFIGPPAAAIRAMGSKSAAKSLMAHAGVPLVPGYHGEDQAADLLQREAARIGFPVLIKASAGGGGKGMKVVERAEAFAAALASAQREAASAFGDNRVLLERYLTTPRHIEVQVFADSHGNVAHLFERDCSIQRRHQKVVEEAPAPGMTPARRAAMGQAAVEAARAVGYVGAGTVEFIVEGEAFYFMEMNTRLQVEHPVSEAITGLDLVEWQIRVARGEPLPLAQTALAVRGHAIEVRLYAEDPSRDFLPQTGRIEHLVLPFGLPGVRIDAGVEAGDEVTIHYDPMLAKIIAAGADRAEAIGRLSAALAATQVTGVATNHALLRAIVAHPAFAAGDLDTGFIARHSGELLVPASPVPDVAIAVAAFAWLWAQRMAQQATPDPADPFSPWAMLGDWWLNADAHTDLVFLDGERQVQVRAQPGNSTPSPRLREEGRGEGLGHWPRSPSSAPSYSETGVANHPAPHPSPLPARGERGQAAALAMSVDISGHFIRIGGGGDPSGNFDLRVDERRLKATVITSASRLTVFLDGDAYGLQHRDPREAPRAAAASAGRLVAPMPGTVVRIETAPGAAVKAGEAMVVIEAMKMEHTVCAPRDGVVAAVHFKRGDLVAEGTELLALEELP